MPEPGELLRDWLTGDPAVARLVEQRVYPLQLPQDPTLPAVTYQVVSAQRERSHGGPSGLGRPRVQVDCWARSYAGAQALKRAVVAALEARSFGAAQVGLVESERDLYEPETDEYRVSLDLVAWLREPVAGGDG